MKPASKAEVRDVVVAAIRRVDPKLADKPIEDSTFAEIRFDSLDHLELVIKIEEELDLSLADSADDATTVRELIDAGLSS